MAAGQACSQLRDHLHTTQLLGAIQSTLYSEQIRPGNDPPPVWPWKKGTARGIAFHPLYPSVPEAAERNPALGELLALFDAVRGGSAREQSLALSSWRSGCSHEPNADTADALRARIRSQSKTVADHIAADPEAQGFIDNWTTPEPISR